MSRPSRLLAAERNNIPFSIKKLQHILDGGEEISILKAKAADIVSKEPLFVQSTYGLSISQHREHTMKKIKRRIELYRSLSPSDELRRWLDYYIDLGDQSVGMRFGVHRILWTDTLMNQGTDEQIRHYGEDTRECRMLGCFAMTELGCGSNIPGLETQARFDPTTDEFVLNSPTITSTKWWIGMAAQTATHCFVYARLLVGERDHGLRTRDGEVRPGIEIGDVGAKMGRQGLDNGWIRFNNHRIPRTNMLMRWNKLERDGTYVPSSVPQISYAALVLGRVSMCIGSAIELKKALTVAVRYSAVREAFGTAILNYQSTQARLLPLLAATYAMHFAAAALHQQYTTMMEQVTKGDFSLLKEVHANSSAMKAFYTWQALEGIEICRQCCGGHGYSAYAGLSTYFADFAVLVAGEGDNSMIVQQACRQLVQSFAKSRAGGQLSGSFAYLSAASADRRLQSSFNFRASEELDLPTIDALLEYIAVRQISDAASRLQEETSNKPAPQAWNETLVDLIEAARAHTNFITFSAFCRAIQDLAGNSPEKEVLTTLARLFGINCVRQKLDILLVDTKLTREQAGALHRAIRALYAQLRPVCVALVDAFALPDFVLQSTLGSYDGNVYERHFEKVKQETASLVGKAPYWDSLIKPLLSAKL